MVDIIDRKVRKILKKTLKRRCYHRRTFRVEPKKLIFDFTKFYFMIQALQNFEIE